MQTFGFTLKDPDFNQGGLGIWVCLLWRNAWDQC